MKKGYGVRAKIRARMSPRPLVSLLLVMLASCASCKHDAPNEGREAAAAVAGPVDPFGVKEIYATATGGREWYLPADATRTTDEWHPQDSLVATGERGVFRGIGIKEPRMDVHSPPGKAWWRNVEMTVYWRLVGVVTDAGLTTARTRQEPHWTVYARGERHTSRESEAAPDTIADGVKPPPGTATWPGYPFDDAGAVNARCLGTSLKSLLYLDGSAEWQKEISHIQGYTNARGRVDSGVRPNSGKWFGYKAIIRNYDGDKAVRMETYVDLGASNDWRRADEVVDEGRGWYSRSDGGVNGCEAPPFNYRKDQAITWAGPYVTFRMDNVDFDMKWASVREIAPLP